LDQCRGASTKVRLQQARKFGYGKGGNFAEAGQIFFGHWWREGNIEAGGLGCNAIGEQLRDGDVAGIEQRSRKEPQGRPARSLLPCRREAAGLARAKTGMSCPLKCTSRRGCVMRVQELCSELRVGCSGLRRKRWKQGASKIGNCLCDHERC
jgi:hypothetical protein